MPSKELQDKIECLEEIVVMACSEGNGNANAYLHGMANGLILALAILRDEDPDYLEAPKTGYLEDQEILNKMTRGKLLQEDDTLVYK